jgi:tetratricopeptide (TPR) repeat protein
MRHRSRFPHVALAVSLATRTVFGDAVARFPDATASSPGGPTPATPGLPAAPVSNDSVRPPELPVSGAQELANRGHAFEDAGHFTEAIRAYSDSIRLDPGSGATLLALGRLRARLGDYGEAELLFSTAARHREFEADALTLRAHVRKAEHRDGEALSDLQGAAELAPDDPVRTTELAAWYVARRAWLPALELYRRVAAEVSQPDLLGQARLQIRALGILAAELDPVAAGSAKDYGFTRRALAKLAKK